jgi:hypothetical protein
MAYGTVGLIHIFSGAVHPSGSNVSEAETFTNIPFPQKICKFFTCNQSIFHIMIQNIKSIVFLPLKQRGHMLNSRTEHISTCTSIWLSIRHNLGSCKHSTEPLDSTKAGNIFTNFQRKL